MLEIFIIIILITVAIITGIFYLLSAILSCIFRCAGVGLLLFFARDALRMMRGIATQ